MADFYLQNEYWFAASQLILAMIGMGATLTGRDFRDVLREPRAVSIGLAIQVVAVPLTAFLFLRLLDVDGGVAVGIALIVAIPGGTVSNIFTFIARGNSALSISVTGITTLACLVTTPIILMVLISQYLPAEFTMPRTKIIREIMFTLLLPLAFGMLYLYLYPRSAATLSKWSIRSSLLVIVFIVVGSAAAGRLDILKFGYTNILLVTLFSVLLSVMVFFLCRAVRLSRPDTTAIEIEVIVRNINLGVLINASLFSATGDMSALGDTVLFTLLLYGSLQLFVGGGLIWSYRRSRS